MVVLAPEATVPVKGAGMTGVLIVGLVDLAADAVAGAVIVDAEAESTGRRRGTREATILCPSFW